MTSDDVFLSSFRADSNYAAQISVSCTTAERYRVLLHTTLQNANINQLNRDINQLTPAEPVTVITRLR